ncbi:predicted protein [Histoplasma capsulatum H143]|uniref:Uncharacterized protein n=1 Tax=Ajellomyces capsulatus (strain H143) TaxID=544712 RepID=C6HSZ5_AJECH|nr:predicted protein [Histoplasma capsulatum H143]
MGFCLYAELPGKPKKSIGILTGWRLMSQGKGFFAKVRVDQGRKELSKGPRRWLDKNDVTASAKGTFRTCSPRDKRLLNCSIQGPPDSKSADETTISLTGGEALLAIKSHAHCALRTADCGLWTADWAIG